MTSNNSNCYIFCNEKKFCPKNHCSFEHITIRTGTYFLLCSVWMEIKGLTLFCLIPFFFIRTFVDNLVLHCSNSFEQLQAKPFFTVRTLWERQFVIVLYSLMRILDSYDLDRTIMLVGIWAVVWCGNGFYIFYLKKQKNAIFLYIINSYTYNEVAYVELEDINVNIKVISKN